MKSLAVIWTLFLATFVSFEKPAHAVSGSLAGVLEFRNELANYCDSATMDCNGALFPASQSNTTRPIVDALVHLVDQTGIVIGQGVTDSTGYFAVMWTRATAPTSIQIRKYFSNNGTRFWLADSGGAAWYAVATTISNPPASAWWVGTWGWYGYDMLHNVYEAMQMFWYNFKFSADMLTKFTYFRVVVPATVTGHLDGVVFVDEDDAKKNWMVTHEAGHGVDYLQNVRKSCGAFNWNGTNTCTGPGTPGSCTGDHYFNSSEWYCSSFTEGLADFLGTIPLYGLAATSPLVCNSVSPCAGGFNLEVSLGSSPTVCVDAVRRQEIQVTRYLWDTYDTVADSGWTDNVPSWPGGRFAAIVDHLDDFPVGTANGQVNEPWNSTLTQLVTPDGRSALDWKGHNDLIENTSNQFTNNCSPGN